VDGGSHLSKEATDGDLVARHRAGDPDAFAALYVRHRPRVYRYVAHRIQESHTIEDLTQEAFATALASIDQLRNPERFYPWLTTITRRLVLAHYAARRHTMVMPEHLVSATEPPESELLRQATEQEVADALNRVTSRHRAVLDLREHQRLSYAAIARRMDTSETAIPTLLHRARNALRREFMAVTDTERFGAITVAIFGAFSLRRVRDRLGLLLRYVPDPGMWGGSMASIVITAAAVLGGGISPDPATVATTTVNAPGGLPQPAWVDNAVGPLEVQETPGDAGHQPAANSPVKMKGRLGVGYYDVGDMEAAARGREQDRHMPYRLEFGRSSVGVDPEAARDRISRSLGGDTSWMEQP